MVRCRECHLGFLNPFPTDEELARIYSHGYYFEDPALSAYLAKEIDGPLKQRKPGGRLLDVGVGGGEFLALATAAGYEAEGVDISAAAVDLCRRRGLPARQCDLRALAAEPSSFDCITMWDVIEHLLEPRDYVEAAVRLLRPGGLLIVKTPNVQWPVMTLSRVLASTGKAGAMLGIPAHVLYFDEVSLRRLLRGARLEIVEMRRIGGIRTARPRSMAAKAYRSLITNLSKVGLAGNYSSTLRSRTETVGPSLIRALS